MRELRYDLNKSNLTMRPKTPDVSKIFDKHKNKKINYTRNVKDNIIENTISYKQNYNKLNSKSLFKKRNIIIINLILLMIMIIYLIKISIFQIIIKRE
jgi:hypothetical protein